MMMNGMIKAGTQTYSWNFRPYSQHKAAPAVQFGGAQSAAEGIGVLRANWHPWLIHGTTGLLFPCQVWCTAAPRVAVAVPRGASIL